MGTGNQSGLKVLISSRDQHPAPAVRGALKLAETATAHGWTTAVTYALADVPDEYHLNGNLARRAHRLASVVVRLRRPPDLGWSLWLAEGDTGFRFTHAFVSFRRYGWSPRGHLPTILERITQP